jgi:hypothetical protein
LSPRLRNYSLSITLSIGRIKIVVLQELPARAFLCRAHPVSSG